MNEVTVRLQTLYDVYGDSYRKSLDEAARLASFANGTGVSLRCPLSGCHLTLKKRTVLGRTVYRLTAREYQSGGEAQFASLFQG